MYLVKEDKVDGKRFIIDGGLVGGFVVLFVLIFYKDFSVGISNYGVFDILVFVENTYKFESYYIEIFVGLYFEDKVIYEERLLVYYVSECKVVLVMF